MYGLIPEANQGAIVHAPRPDSPAAGREARRRRTGAVSAKREAGQRWRWRRSRSESPAMLRATPSG